jgi:hypothetical protein
MAGCNRGIDCVPQELDAFNRAKPLVPLGILYTDPQGEIVFANRNSLVLVRYAQDEPAIGSTLHQVLGLERHEVEGLLAVSKPGERAGLILMVDAGDAPARFVLCSSKPAFEYRGNFIGTNITLSALEEVHVREAGLVEETGLDELIETAAEEEAPEENHLEAYFASVLEATQALLARLAGPAVREDLVRAVDALAAGNGWPVRVQEEQFAAGAPEAALDIYSALVQEALDYATAVVGRRVLAHAIEALHAGQGADVLEAADESGLRAVVEGRS